MKTTLIYILRVLNILTSGRCHHISFTSELIALVTTPARSRKKSMLIKTTFITHIVLFLFCILFTSCDEFLQVPAPKDQLVSASVFSDDQAALAAANGIYEEMMNSGALASGSFNSVTFLAALSSDEITYTAFSSDYMEFGANEVQVTNSTLQGGLWTAPYQYIYDANSILEGAAASSTLSDSIRRQVTGEARFIRAFCYFYLTGLFGDVPLITSTDYRINRVAARTAKEEVYQLIIEDLLRAKESLPSDYLNYNNERTRPTRYAASALLARTYLFTGHWEKAEAEATDVINTNSLYAILPELNDVFLANSYEAIWQLQPVSPGINTNEGSLFILDDALNSAVISPALAGAFEENDLRLSSWTDTLTVDGVVYYYPYKYKVRYSSDITEYSMVIRLAELYLIRAEARARLLNTSGAIADLDVLRRRAGIPLISENNPSLSGDELLNAIARERQVELFTEWGHRWMDLQRTGKADDVLSPLKPGWQSSHALYPIPQSEILNDPSLIQNPGY
jgi:hypothetical protein